VQELWLLELKRQAHDLAQATHRIPAGSASRSSTPGTRDLAGPRQTLESSVRSLGFRSAKRFSSATTRSQSTTSASSSSSPAPYSGTDAATAYNTKRISIPSAYDLHRNSQGSDVLVLDESEIRNQRAYCSVRAVPCLLLQILAIGREGASWDWSVWLT
jgi:hypothetical protein